MKEEENSSQEDAIKRADKLFQNTIEWTPADKNPCTTIHELVKELNQYL